MIPKGLSTAELVDFTKGLLSEEEARDLKKTWLERFPEMTEMTEMSEKMKQDTVNPDILPSISALHNWLESSGLMDTLPLSEVHDLEDLVADAFETGVKSERGACARLCAKGLLADARVSPEFENGWKDACEANAKDIRARGEES